MRARGNVVPRDDGRREAATMERIGSNAGMDDGSGARTPAGGLSGRPGLRIDAAPADVRSAGRLERFRAACAGPLAMRGVVVALAMMMIAFSIAPLWNVARGTLFNKDYDLWQITGHIVLDGQDIYPRTPGLPYPFMYPP